jgi:putative NADH-flavin reductase
MVVGATGSLGGAVAREALSAGHQVSLLVRTPSRLPAEIASKASVHQGDLTRLAAAELADLIRGHDALINCAGLVTEGQAFVELFDRVVSSAETLPGAERPVSWFLGGAALLDLDDRGRRGIQLPKVQRTYWPHGANFERLRRSSLDWRLLCPGPMVDQPKIGLERLRVSRDRLPVGLPRFVRLLPTALLLPLFAARIPEMIVPYADAASVMLANLSPRGPMMHHRIGIALPPGMLGKKEQWAARPRNAT